MREGMLVAGKYKLLKLIGTGGMGAVWLSRNEMTEREFAIKFLHPQAANNPKVLTRFLQEAKVSGRLRHPSILEIFDVGVAPELDGAPFLVMELLDGAPLDVAIRLLGGIPMRLTLQIALAMSRALAVAHSKGVVHRDLKPANVFLHRTHTGGILPKLLDFGISKLSPLDTSGSEGMGLTQTGAVLGSPLYMSPEQAAGDKHVDGRSDLHALGVLMWWCIVGKSPFKSTTYNTLVVEIITGERPVLIDVKPDVGPGVSDIVSKCFARKRDDRYVDTTKLVEALEAEVTKLGPGPSLESREWVEEIFTRLRVTSDAGVPQRGPQEPREMTTNGAVSVSIDDVLPESSEMQSPAAYTMDSKRSMAAAGGDAIAPASLASQSNPSNPSFAIAQGSTMSSSAGTPAGVPRRFGIVPLIAAASLAAFLLGGLGIGLVALSRGSHGSSAASVAAHPTDTSMATAASVAAASPAVQPSVTAPAVVTTLVVDAGAPAPVAVAAGGSTPSSGGPSRTNAGSGARSQGAPVPKPVPAHAAATTPAPVDPFRGVSGTGE